MSKVVINVWNTYEVLKPALIHPKETPLTPSDQDRGGHIDKGKQPSLSLKLALCPHSAIYRWEESP
jgi:hypothetical protein